MTWRSLPRPKVDTRPNLFTHYGVKPGPWFLLMWSMWFGKPKVPALASGKVELIDLCKKGGSVQHLN